MESCFVCGVRAEILIPCKYLKTWGYDDRAICPNCFAAQYLARRVSA